MLDMDRMGWDKTKWRANRRARFSCRMLWLCRSSRRVCVAREDSGVRGGLGQVQVQVQVHELRVPWSWNSNSSQKVRPATTSSK